MDYDIDAVEPGSLPSEELISADSSSQIAKVNLLSSDSVEFYTWYDVQCGVCGNRCCSPCTANGNIGSCAETRFRSCNRCGHPSASHRAVRH